MVKNQKCLNIIGRVLFMYLRYMVGVELQMVAASVDIVQAGEKTCS